MTGGSLPLRRLAFAGRWYTGDPVRLAEEVDAMLASAARRATPARAVISPHAGLRYSGPVAAWSYSALGAQAVDAVILVGPSHYQAFRGCAMLGHGAVETPWRPLPIAEDLASALAGRTTVVRETGADIHAQEHSLELQLPFLSRVLPEVPIVPILMGEQTRDVAFSLGDAIADIAGGLAVALVASSDLSHYEDRVTAHALDAQVLEALERCDADLLMEPVGARAAPRLRRGTDGRGAASGDASRRRTGRRPEVRRLGRRYRRHFAGRRLRGSRLRRAMMLAEEDRALLISLAREAIQAAVMGDPGAGSAACRCVSIVGGRVRDPDLTRRAARLHRSRPSPTIRSERSSSTAPRRPRSLTLDFRQCRAMSSSRSPLRFRSSRPLSAVISIDRIDVGRHGLIVEQGRNRGLLLPQVATEHGWSREEFLSHTCRKAGLPVDAWRRGAQIFCFEAEYFWRPWAT